MKNKTAILFTTRNCYQLFDGIFFNPQHTKQDFSDYYVFNIDLNSDAEQQELRKFAQEKFNLIDIPVDVNDRNIYSVNKDIELCAKYIEENELDIEWLIWCSHDTVFSGENFLKNFEDILDSNPRFKTEVGSIGFGDYGQIEEGKACYGRSNLLQGMVEVGKAFVQNVSDEYVESDYFLVEAPNDNIVAVNLDLYRKHIEFDPEFILFYVWDDIAAQFGLKQIASITIPSLHVVDLFREKPKYNLQRSIFSGTDTHIDSYQNAADTYQRRWREKYGFYRGLVPPTKEEFNNLDDLYNESIQKKIFSWHVNDGPKTLDDLGVRE
tara:strand:- start:566 stop:1534 length:969 start_codon:yes stop_codon:yes gene_type:complete